MFARKVIPPFSIFYIFVSKYIYTEHSHSLFCYQSGFSESTIQCTLSCKTIKKTITRRTTLFLIEIVHCSKNINLLKIPISVLISTKYKYQVSRQKMILTFIKGHVTDISPTFGVANSSADSKAMIIMTSQVNVNVNYV